MEDDQQVAVLMHLDLNGAVGETGDVDSSWQDEFSSATQDISINDSSENDLQHQNLDQNIGDNVIQKDLEFIKKHVAEADPDFLLSLLDSQIDNPKRLETVMCEILNIPNASKLIQEFRQKHLKVGAKRSVSNSNTEAGEIKKKKIEGSGNYLQQIRDMFPDADGLFLISECQQLENSEDFSRFINTVMISGVYPKKREMEYSTTNEPPKVIDIVNDREYRTALTCSSEEEISSSGLSVSPRKQRRRRRRKSHGNSLNGSPNEANAGLAPPEIEVIDVVSDNTESYDPPDPEILQEIFNNSVINNTMEVEEEISVEPNAWETSLVEDIDNLLEKKFGNQQTNNDDNSDVFETPVESPSRLPTGYRPRLSLPSVTSDSFAYPERSLAEIIEESRHNRRRSLDSRFPVLNDFQKPSTSKAEAQDIKSVLTDSFNGEVSSPEVSTTSDYRKERLGSDVDTMILEEGEEVSKVNDDWLDEQTANLIRIFPNTDPSYIRGEVAKMNGCSEAMNEFVISKLERNDMPTRAEYEKKKEMEELQNRYTNNFSIEDFLKAVPDPWKYFTQGNRNCAKYKSHSLCYLKSTFRNRYVRDIIDTFNKNNFNLYLSYHDLKKESKKRRGSRRSEFECNSNRPTTIDIQFLQEVAFLENEEKIRDHLEGEKIARQIKFDEAKRTGSLLECQCCFDSEVLVEDIVYCPKDHPFCKECIIKSVEVEMGNGRCQFECLASCEEKFTLACLQNVLKPELFSKVIQANQMEEIRAAEIEDLVQCPFCNYATIMPPEEKVMTCLNPECLKESCRLCKELNHIPLRCDEVEKSEEVKMRTYIENKMTEALVRTCYKCGKKFVKEDGCNKMTCTCGAKMCYVCRKPVTSYSHFNGQGGTEYHKCPLYSRNDELHVDLVRKVAEEAKAEILQANPQTKLLHDPTIIMPERTHDVPMPGMDNGVALNVGLRAIREMFNQNGEEADTQGRRRQTGVGHSRRGDRQEANPYYNRYHRHRQRAQIESEDEDNNDHQHHCNHNHHRHRHHENQIRYHHHNENENHYHHHNENRYHHHHRHLQQTHDHRHHHPL